ncbi:MAG TPA: DinB family protein [Actinomycetota bacterium]|nr:DinB family protein [Actinomycetota bacterium]
MADIPTLEAQQLPGYEAEIGAALWRMQDSRRRTIRLLGEIPSEFVDRASTDNTIGTILYHLGLIEADWLFTEILEEPFSAEIGTLLSLQDRDEAGVLTSVQGRSLEEHIAQLNAIRDTFLEKLSGMTLEDFHRPRSLPRYHVSPAWVLHHLSQHEAEHRGEIESVVSCLTAGTAGGNTGSQS